MNNYSVSCAISVRGVGEPDYSFSPPPAIISAYDEADAIEIYCSQLLDNPDYYWVLETSSRIISYVIS